MPHVDEGQVHAYLDQQLEYADPTKRQELEEHIATCPSCASLLEEARALRDRANALLRDTGPAQPAVPPFEAIVERAAGMRAQKPVAKRLAQTRSLAWAASVLLALALGLYARPYIFGPEVALAPAARQARSDAELDAVRPALAVDSAVGTAGEVAAPQPRSATAVSEGLAAPSVPEAPSRQPTDEAAERRDRVREEVAAEVQAAPAPDRAQELTEEARDARAQFAAVPVAQEREAADTLARKVSPQELADRPARAQQAPADRRAVDRDAVPAEPAAGGLADFSGAARGRTVTVGASTIEAAAEHLGGPLLVVADLEVVDVAIDSVGSQPAARIVQRLESNDALELLMWRGGATEEFRAFAEAPSTADVSVLTIDVAGYRVRGRARLPIDSLRALLRRLREAPSPN
jgi:hypothetical protein